MKPFLAGTDAEELTQWAEEKKLPKFRVKQVLDWVFKKRQLNPSEMKNLPAGLREQISDYFLCDTMSVVDVQEADDNTRKLLIRLHDGEYIESVVIPAKDRNTFCLSTQVGCPVGCVFCSSGENGLVRNLSTGEIIEQFFLTAGVLGGLPDNIVFMGIGEGLLNFNNLVKALNLISDDTYVGYGARRITVSTSGWVPNIYKLADLKKQWTLAISLHAPTDEVRSKIIPDKFRHPLNDIFEAVKYYEEKTNRMVTFEYVLLKDLNDSDDCAYELAKVAKQCHAKINLIPFNSGILDSNYQRPSQNRITSFADILRKKQASVTVRQEKGSSIKAACGQLRQKNDKH